MPQLFDISDWDELSWYSTGGTRAKRYLQNHQGEKYYFKQSYKKEVIDYKFEFWSEIIASEIGKEFGFDLLQYDLATDGKIMGCICRSMIESDEQELNEGGKYLQAYDNSFVPDVKSTRSQYSFQLVQRAFELFNLEEYMDKFIHMLIFDALIGNSDRHQENWAFITTHGELSSMMLSLQNETKASAHRKIPRWIRFMIWINKIFENEGKINKEDTQILNLYFQNIKSFSPIYDSGSSLGRELSMEKVDQMLTDKIQLDAYLRRGTSEIHWDGKKINHFDLIKNIMLTCYAEIVIKRIQQLEENFDMEKVQEIVASIDNGIPVGMEEYKLPQTRKTLITKMITLRSQKLRAIIA